MGEGASCARGGAEFGNAKCETLATSLSARMVSAEDALAACECLTKEGLRCCGVGLE